MAGKLRLIEGAEADVPKKTSSNKKLSFLKSSLFYLILHDSIEFGLFGCSDTRIDKSMP
jgi:hypothetical protein